MRAVKLWPSSCDLLVHHWWCDAAASNHWSPELGPCVFLDWLSSSSLLAPRTLGLTREQVSSVELSVPFPQLLSVAVLWPLLEEGFANPLLGR